MVLKRSFVVPPVPSHLEKWGGGTCPPCPLVPAPLLVCHLSYCIWTLLLCITIQHWVSVAMLLSFKWTLCCR